MNRFILPTPTTGLAKSILGTWILESRKDVDIDDNQIIDTVLGENPAGILSFSPGYFSAQFMKRERSSYDSLAKPIQGENNSIAVDGYDAYFGTYTLNEADGTVSVRLIGSISPENIGNNYIRDIRVMGNKLVIQLPTTSVYGVPITRTLIFTNSAKN